MATYHVYPGQSISDAVNNASPGDIVYLRAGIFTGELVRIDNLGTEANPIYVLAYPGEQPVIDGQNQGGTWDELVKIAGGYIVFDGIEVKRAAYSGIIVDGTNITIRNVYCHHNTGNGIHVRGDYGLVEHCTVYWNSANNEYGKAPPGAWGAGLTAARYPSNVILRHNIVYNNWGEGLSAFEASNITIEDNAVYDNWSVQLYLDNVDTATVQRNLAYDTDDPNFSGKRASVISIADEDYGHPGWTQNITLVNNLAMGGSHPFRYGREIADSGLKNCLIAYNTFANSQRSKTFQIISGNHSNTRIENNIILEEDPAIPIADVPDDPGLAFDYNLWSKTPGPDAQGPHDAICNPLLAKTCEIAPGKLTCEWFRPLSGSPAFNAATTPHEIGEDYERQPRDAVSPTIGAIENADIAPPPPSQAIVDFETGDLTQFDSVETSGGDFSAHVDAAMEGSYGGKFVVDDTSDRWGQIDFANKTRLRVGFYFDPNSITMENGDAWNLAKDPSPGRFRIRFAKTVSGYTVQAQVWTDARVWYGGDAVALSDEPHWVEADYKISSAPGANDGFAKIWVDPGSPPFGEPDSQATTIDNDQQNFNHVRVGAVSGLEATTTGTFYVDYIAVNDTGKEMGPPSETPIPVTMPELSDRIQKADWKKEKHVPVIEAPDQVKADKFFEVKVSLGKEIAHPNTTEHHISWISLYFHPEGEKFTYQVGRFEFSAHGESVAGPNEGPVYTHHEVTASLKVSKSGTLHALALCNIHGLWESSKEISVG